MRGVGLRWQVLAVLTLSLGAGFAWTAYAMTQLVVRLAASASHLPETDIPGAETRTIEPRAGEGSAGKVRGAEPRKETLAVDEPASSRRAWPGSGHLVRLLLFYLTLSGVAALLLTYVFLTQVLVRPLDRLRMATLDLAQGSVPQRLPERGAREIVELARMFRHMHRELAAERQSREHRMRALEETGAALRKTQAQLVRSTRLATVGKIAAGLAHEMGNPLAAVIGMLELLRSGQLSSEKEQEFLRRIEQESQRMHRTLRALLDFSRTDDKREAKQHQADLREVLRRSFRLVQPHPDARDVEICVRDLSAVASTWLCMDAGHVPSQGFVPSQAVASEGTAPVAEVGIAEAGIAADKHHEQLGVRVAGPPSEWVACKGVAAWSMTPSHPVQVYGSPERLEQLFVNLLLNAADAMGGMGRITVTLLRMAPPPPSSLQHAGSSSGATPAPAMADATSHASMPPAGLIAGSQAAHQEAVQREAAGQDRRPEAWSREEGAVEGHWSVCRWVVWVEDEGPGIAQEVTNTLFDPFVTTKPAGKGTGLGLAVCKAIVEECDGMIDVRPSPGGGAIFRVGLRG